MHWASPADSLYLGGGRKCGQPWRGGTARHAGLVATCITLDISCKLIPHCADKVKTVAVACHCVLCAIGDDSAFCSLNFLSHCVSWRAVESSIGLTGCSAWWESASRSCLICLAAATVQDRSTMFWAHHMVSVVIQPCFLFCRLQTPSSRRLGL